MVQNNKNVYENIDENDGKRKINIKIVIQLSEINYSMVKTNTDCFLNS